MLFVLNKFIHIKGCSQEQLAEALGISRQAVSKWERAESSPDTDNLFCLAKLYGISLDDLLKTDDSLDEIIKDKAPEIVTDEDETGIAGVLHTINVFLIIILYFVLGSAFELWHPGWIIFLTIPLYYTFCNLFKKKK